jgi:hypothetical protein
VKGIITYPTETDSDITPGGAAVCEEATVCPATGIASSSKAAVLIRNLFIGLLNK